MSSHDMKWFYLLQLPLIGLCVFFGAVVGVATRNRGMFFQQYARSHRSHGLMYLTWLLVGLVHVLCASDTLGQISELLYGTQTAVSSWGESCHRSTVFMFVYDVVLGLLGVQLTLSAARGFGSHKHTNNVASGVLDNEATVSHSEMMEHSFYQGLNLAQVLYMHTLAWVHSLYVTVSPTNSGLAVLLILLGLVSLPWYFRNRFPINRFSDNYRKGQKVTSLVSIMYRLKKYQYVLYKHFLFHGLNITLAVFLPSHKASLFVYSPIFRAYWLCLNTAYTMEFFLQTLVKRRMLSQHSMLALNQLLMAASMVIALRVLYLVDVPAATMSLVLNFLNRGHDFSNVWITLLLTKALKYALFVISIFLGLEHYR